jgi:hypothetical protein
MANNIIITAKHDGKTSLTMATGKRAGFHYAWTILAVTFACLFVASALRSVPGIIMLSLEHEFNWSRETISGAVSINLLLFGLAGPFLGRLMDFMVRESSPC